MLLGRRNGLGAAQVAMACFAIAGLSTTSCKRPEMASPAQCEKLLDRFIDLKLSEDPRAPSMTSEERARLRGTLAGEVQSDSDVRQVKNQCQTEVTAAEYRCAIEARTSKAWNDCIE
jgi:hypothetical protein